MILLSLTRLKMVLLLIGIKCKELADFLINFVIFIFIFISFQVIVVSAACRSIEVGNSFAANVHCSYFQYISTLDRGITLDRCSVLDWCSDFGGGRALRMGIVEAEGQKRLVFLGHFWSKKDQE